MRYLKGHEISIYIYVCVQETYILIFINYLLEVFVFWYLKEYLH